MIGNDVSRAYPWPGEGGRGARAVECTRSATTAFNVIVDYIISNRRRQAIRAAHACAHVRKKALAERPILYASESRSRRAGIASSFLLPTNARSSSPFFPFEDRGVARRVFRSDADAIPDDQHPNDFKSYIEISWNRIFFLSLLLSSIGRISPSLELGEKKERRIARRIAKLARVRRDKKGTRIKETSL